MIWWVVRFAATVVALSAKYYLTTSAKRLRQSLLLEQREALVLKGELTNLRQDQRGQSKLVREAEVKRLKSVTAHRQAEIYGLEDELKH